MDWLAGYHAVMNYFNKTVKPKVDHTNKEMQFMGARRKIKGTLGSHLPDENHPIFIG